MTTTVNNAFYDQLGDRWYDDDTHAIALLRVEARTKVAYLAQVLTDAGVGPGARVLDVACGAGFCAIPLAEAGWRVHGVDLSPSSIATARRRAAGVAGASFAVGDALALREPAGAYDAVLLLDFLEHVENPAAAIAAAARALRPGGVMAFHTFNRTLPAYLLAVKALEVFTRDCPERVHAYELFIKPAELAAMAGAAGVNVREWRGLRPRIGNAAFWRSVLRRRVDPGFAFTLSRSLAVGYVGYGIKR